MEKENAVKMLKHIAYTTNEISLMNQLGGSVGMMMKIYRTIVAECRQRQWVDEEILRMLGEVEENSLDELAFAASTLASFIN